LKTLNQNPTKQSVDENEKKMFNMNDGPRMVMDGTYVNAPDVHDSQRKIGLREFNNGVLVHNWYESRADVNK